MVILKSNVPDLKFVIKFQNESFPQPKKDCLDCNYYCKFYNYTHVLAKKILKK